MGDIDYTAFYTASSEKIAQILELSIKKFKEYEKLDAFGINAFDLQEYLREQMKEEFIPIPLVFFGQLAYQVLHKPFTFDGVHIRFIITPTMQTDISIATLTEKVLGYNDSMHKKTRK